MNNKHLIAILIGAVSCLGASAALNTYEKITVEGVEYVLSPQGYLSVDKIENNPGFVNLPNTIRVDGTEYSIGELKGDVFRHNMNLSGVILPDNLQIISADAFYNCYQLRAIAIPASVKSIGDNGYSVKPVFEDTPLETISFLGTQVPKGDLNGLFKSPYLKQIVVPAEAAEAFETACPAIKEGRIKVYYTLEDDVKYYYYRAGASFIPFQKGYYPLYVANSSAEIPNEAVFYVTPGSPLPLLLNQPDISGGGGIDVKIEGTGTILSVNADMPSSIYVTDGDYSHREVFAGDLVYDLEEGSHIKVVSANAEVTEVAGAFPETFAIYAVDGTLIKSQATNADLEILGKNIYILKAGDRSRKVFVEGK